MKKRAVILSIFLIFILPQIVLAVGISPPGYEANMIYGQSKEFGFYAINTMGYPMDLEIGVGGGELDDYITVDSDVLTVNPGEWKPFTVRIDYPAEPLNPGIHKISASVTELREEAGMITARAAVTSKIYLREAYPGLYAEAVLNIRDKNINETVPIELVLYNYGTELINTATGSVDIYFNEEKVKTLELSSVENIETYKSKSMKAEFDTKEFNPGIYTAKATVNYDGKTTTAETGFKIGTLHVDIIDFTKQAYQNKINPFEITIESKWNEEIKNIFADVKVKENNSVAKSFRTISEGLGKWEKKTILGHLDAEGLSLGIHDIEMYLNYEGLQTIQKEKINITEEIKEPVVEEPSKLPAYVTALIIALTAVLIAVIIFLIMSIKRKKSGEKKIVRAYPNF